MEEDYLRSSKIRIKHQKNYLEIEKYKRELEEVKKELENPKPNSQRWRLEVYRNIFEKQIFKLEYNSNENNPNYKDYQKHTESIDLPVENLQQHPFYKYLDYTKEENGNICLVYNNGPRRGQVYFKYLKKDFEENVSQQKIQTEIDNIIVLIQRIGKDAEKYTFDKLIGKNNMRKLNLTSGSMPGISEVMAYDFVPLEYIDKIAVPRFKVQEVKKILENHIYADIDVIANSR